MDLLPRPALGRTARTGLSTVGLCALLLASGAPSPGLAQEPAEALPPAATEELARGLTHSELTLGDPQARHDWTVQLTLPSGDPAVRDSALSSRSIADDTAQRLRDLGFEAAAQEVEAQSGDAPADPLGHRVRVGSLATQQEAEALRIELRAAGFPGAVWYQGWDADRSSLGPVEVHVLTIDPRRFQGSVGAAFGPDLETPEITSELSAGSLAAINGGFFVFGAQHGAPGDPAGAGAYDGEILSETVGDRPSLVIDQRRGRAEIERLTWWGRVSAGATGLELDGINRVPGLIRNCGGIGDAPTDTPQHDVTCTDDDELVAFTPEFGPTTPSGEGAEIVLDRRGRVVAVHDARGTELLDGQRSIQATGRRAQELRGLASSTTLRLRHGYLDENGRAVPMTPQTQVINGGPTLLVDGAEQISTGRDGMIQPQSPGQYYGWSHQRNPRTVAGVDGQGRLVLITVDGRQTDSVGMSLAETADLARRLGLVQALNLDGGGSTTMTIGGDVVNGPSGGAERPVGDALVIRAR